MHKSLVLITALVLFLLAAYNPSDAERARWTMGDMVSWKICVDAYAKDHGGAYPEATTLEQLRDAVQPIYIRHAPMVDAWGNPYRYERTEKGYRLSSAGSDGKFDAASWATAAKQLPFDADAVVTNEGRWLVRSWELQ